MAEILPIRRKTLSNKKISRIFFGPDLFFLCTYVYFRLSYVCLFVWGLSSRTIIFHSYGDVTIAGEELQIMNYARHSWPLSSEGSSHLL